MDALVVQVFITIDFAVVWADVMLPNLDAMALLYYEILRAEDTITKLGKLATLAHISNTPTWLRSEPSKPSRRSSSGSGLVTPKSPTSQAFHSFPLNFSTPEPTGPASESMRNLDVVRSHFGGKIADFKEKNGTTIVEAQQVLDIIKSSIDGLDLRESMALEEGGTRRYTESEHKIFFAELVRVVSDDVLKLTDLRINP